MSRPIVSRPIANRRWLAIAVAAMLAVGALGWGMAALVSRDARPADLAVVDALATDRVRTEVSRILTQVLSYDYSDPQAMRAAADQLLTGDARKEHEVLFRAMQDKAGDQQVVLSTQVQAAAVKELRGDSASLLVFLDQSSRRADDEEARVSAAQLAVEATKVDGVWKVSGLEPL